MQVRFTPGPAFSLLLRFVAYRCAFRKKQNKSCSREQRKKMPTAQGYTAVPDADEETPTTDDALRHAGGEETCFPTRAVVILTLGMTVNSYAMVSLFPYAGMMVKELLSLQSTNEIGEQRETPVVHYRGSSKIYETSNVHIGSRDSFRPFSGVCKFGRRRDYAINSQCCVETPISLGRSLSHPPPYICVYSPV